MRDVSGVRAGLGAGLVNCRFVGRRNSASERLPEDFHAHVFCTRLSEARPDSPRCSLTQVGTQTQFRGKKKKKRKKDRGGEEKKAGLLQGLVPHTSLSQYEGLGGQLL